MIKKGIIIKIKFAAILKNDGSNSFFVKFILQSPKIKEDRKYLVFSFVGLPIVHTLSGTPIIVK